MKTTDSQTRKGLAVAAAGIVCNALLSVAKITVGFVLGLISVVADGFNNLGDCGSGIVATVSLCVAAKPADKEHPFGHRRAEYVAAMVTGFLVLTVAVGLLVESIHKAAVGAAGIVRWSVYIVLGVSVAAKAAMFVFYRVTASRIGSDSLKAAATDSLCDCVATVAVIVSAVLAEFGIAADGWAGIAVALFVGWQGARIVHEAGSKLLGQAPSVSQVNRIKALILSCEGVLGLHDLRIFNYGNGASFATVHVEMDARLTSLQAHALLDELERRVRSDEGVDLTAHFDPVDTQDSEAMALEREIRAAAEKAVNGVDINYFRIVRGAVVKLLFDAGVPFETKLSDAEVERRIVAAVKSVGDYEVNVNVERE